MKRVLIIDDMKTVRLKLKKLCQKLGFDEILEAKDGQEALEILDREAENLNLILSDCNMPNLTGRELLKKIKENQKTKDIPFMFITSESERQMLVESFSLGVAGYIVKPFTDEEVTDKITNIMAESPQA